MSLSPFQIMCQNLRKRSKFQCVICIYDYLRICRMFKESVLLPDPQISSFVSCLSLPDFPPLPKHPPRDADAEKALYLESVLEGCFRVQQEHLKITSNLNLTPFLRKKNQVDGGVEVQNFLRKSTQKWDAHPIFTSVFWSSCHEPQKNRQLLIGTSFQRPGSSARK